jgi:hypothetical protein
MKILKLPITTTMLVCSKEVYSGPKLMMSYGTREPIRLEVVTSSLTSKGKYECELRERILSAKIYHVCLQKHDPKRVEVLSEAIRKCDKFDQQCTMASFEGESEYHLLEGQMVFVESHGHASLKQHIDKT